MSSAIIIRCVSLAVVLISLSGCASLLPDQPRFNNSILMPKMVVETTPAAVPGAAPPPATLEPKTCADFDALQAPGLPDSRNACVIDLMQMIDDAFQKYEAEVNNRIGDANFSLDTLATAGSAAATASSGTTAKILSAISSVASGSKTAISEDLLYKATVQVLLTTMHANREKDAAAIKLSMRQSISAYPMNIAKGDILKYLNDGTLINAFASVNQSASATAQTCADANQAVSTAAKSGALSAAQAKNASVAGARSTRGGAGTPQTQCAQISQAISYNMDSSAGAVGLLGAVFHDNALDTTAVTKLNGCAKSVAAPAGFDMSKYNNPDGTIDTAQIISDPSVEASYKEKLLSCVQAAASRSQKVTTRRK